MAHTHQVSIPWPQETLTSSVWPSLKWNELKHCSLSDTWCNIRKKIEKNRSIVSIQFLLCLFVFGDAFWFGLLRGNNEQVLTKFETILPSGDMKVIFTGKMLQGQYALQGQSHSLWTMVNDLALDRICTKQQTPASAPCWHHALSLLHLASGLAPVCHRRPLKRPTWQSSQLLNCEGVIKLHRRLIASSYMLTSPYTSLSKMLPEESNFLNKYIISNLDSDWRSFLKFGHRCYFNLWSLFLHIHGNSLFC